MRRSWWFVVGELHGSRHLLVLLPRRGDESPAGVGCSQHTYQHTLLLLKAPPRSPLCYLHREIYTPFVATGHNFTDGIIYSALIH